jgi:hypothetical protein
MGMPLLEFFEFEKRVYEYCDENIGRTVLFTAFDFLWPIPKENSENSYLISKKELKEGTSKLLDILTKKKIIKEVEKPEGLEYSIYPLYEILPHKNLVGEYP